MENREFLMNYDPNGKRVEFPFAHGIQNRVWSMRIHTPGYVSVNPMYFLRKCPMDIYPTRSRVNLLIVLQFLPINFPVYVNFQVPWTLEGKERYEVLHYFGNILRHIKEILHHIKEILQHIRKVSQVIMFLQQIGVNAAWGLLQHIQFNVWLLRAMGMPLVRRTRYIVFYALIFIRLPSQRALNDRTTTGTKQRAESQLHHAHAESSASKTQDFDEFY